MPPPSGETVPLRAQDLTETWLTACLRHAGVLGEGRVASCTQQRIGQGKGFAGHLARLELAYAEPLPDSPRYVIAKFGSEQPATRDMMKEVGGYEREVRFYRELGDDIGVPVPRCYFAHYDHEGGQFLLLLEDLAPAASPGYEQGLSLPQARTVMEQLAVLHATWWNRTEGFEWLMLDDDRTRSVRDQFLEAVPNFHAQWGASLPYIDRIARRMVEVFQGDEWVDDLRAGPVTLVHNDMHVENIFLPTAQGGRFAFIDWQVMGFGAGIGDVTRILSMGMQPALRRAHALELLEHYHRRLVELGVTDYSLGQLKWRYRREMVTMVIVGVMAFSNIDFEADDSQQVAEVLGERIELSAKDSGVHWGVTGVVLWLRLRRWVARLLGRRTQSRL